MVANGKVTRNADYRHAQSIGRQRQAAQRAAAEVSPEDVAAILPHDESPMLPDAAPMTTPADKAPSDMPRPSWRDRYTGEAWEPQARLGWPRVHGELGITPIQSA